MSTDDLRTVMVRELRSLAREIAAYPSDRQLWSPVPGITNPGGTLALHLAGNIQHFIGALLGGSDYKRDRDAEFGRRDLTRAQVVDQVERAIVVAEEVLPTLDAATLAAEYPAELAGRRFTTSRFLAHLATHLAYHLGQVDYHRRIVAPESGTVGTMSPAVL